MQEEIRLNFVALNFLSCYHQKNMFYQWSTTQAFFQEGIQLCELTKYFPEDSSVMQLLQWNGPIQQQNDQTERVLMQILKITPLIFEEGQQESSILHEIAIVTWTCEVAESIGVCFTRIFKLRRLHHTRIFVVLSEVIDEDWIHCFKNGHLGCLLSKEKWEKILKNSVSLEKSLEEKLEWGVLVTIGVTEQKATVNCHQISKANKLRSLVYDQINISFVTLEEISAGGTVINPRLTSTQNLELVIQIRNEIDTFEDY